MPHCQKENHNRAAKSKKEKQKAKQATAERKKKLAEAAAAAEAEAALKLSNNVAPVEGHGAYEIGYEEEPEYTRFNVKKRSKKHLRNDLRKRMLREAQEEEERIKKQQEEEYRQQQKALKEAAGEESSEEEEEEPPVLEYLVYVCECCDKRYATKNQFLNHLNSKKHKHKVKVFESMGLLVTHVELRGENGNEKELYDDYVDEDDDDEDGSDNEGDKKNTNTTKSTSGGGNESENDSDEESEDESDDDYAPAPKRKNVFAAFGGFSSSSEDEESDDSESEDDRKPPAVPLARRKDPPPSKEDEKKDDDHIDLDELIHQNQLIQNEIDAQQEDTVAELPPTPLPFHETYDKDDYTVNEQRLVSVQHRLRKNLAAKGIEAKKPAPSGYDPMEAITMGKTLLQEVLEANIDTLQQKLDAYRKHKEHCQLMCKQYNLAKGNSKAIASQYVFKQDAADNARRRANVHHAGSHYHMQAARTMQFGRQKGLMARHSSQGARLQASRMAAKETARMQQGGGGMKIGKTSKKSNQKKRGEAGGSKKSGGKKGKASAGGD